MAIPHIKPSHKGRLHQALGVPEGSPIPAGKLMSALHSKDPHKRSMGNFARMAKRHWKPLSK
jgi:hypothetical protein